MDIDTFYKEMDKAHRLIYLVNVFNSNSEYIDMKFYEFDDGFEYYALIGAKNEQEATEYYKEVVCDIDISDSKPIEITKEGVKDILLENEDNEEEQHEAIEEFVQHVYKDEPYLVLIDSSLA